MYTLGVPLQSMVLLDPYAKVVMGRRKFGELGPVSTSRPLCSGTHSLAPLIRVL